MLAVLKANMFITAHACSWSFYRVYRQLYKLLFRNDILYFFISPQQKFNMTEINIKSKFGVNMAVVYVFCISILFKSDLTLKHLIFLFWSFCVRPRCSEQTKRSVRFFLVIVLFQHL